MDIEDLVEAARAKWPNCESCRAVLRQHDNEFGPNLMCAECGCRHCPFYGAEVDEGEHFITSTGEIQGDSGYTTSN